MAGVKGGAKKVRDATYTGRQVLCYKGKGRHTGRQGSERLRGEMGGRRNGGTGKACVRVAQEMVSKCPVLPAMQNAMHAMPKKNHCLKVPMFTCNVLPVTKIPECE